MKDWGKALSALVWLSAHMVWADDTTTSPATAAPASAAPAPATTTTTAPATDSSSAAASTSSSDSSPATAPASGDKKAEAALKQQASDASSEKNLAQVFDASQPTYSLLRKGGATLYYTFDYTYYYNAAIDIALTPNSSSISRFRIEEDAQDTVTNSLSLDYGVWDNLTFNTLLPMVAKYDSTNNLTTMALGDASFSARWQPVPEERGAMSTTLFGVFSTASGVSPYNINLNTDLSTGKGYYSLTGGASFSKVLDPVVVFGSFSDTLGLNVTGLNQNRAGQLLTAFQPGATFSGSAGLGYSLNYDISITASYQMGYTLATTYDFAGGTTVRTPDMVAASINFSVGFRTTPTQIINIGFAYGLTQDTPNIDLTVTVPMDISGMMKTH
ncbi:MAG: transporter [Pseudomonadales bacterium]|nr:transporter [Pseudomonadales bacterium]